VDKLRAFHGDESIKSEWIHLLETRQEKGLIVRRHGLDGIYGQPVDYVRNLVLPASFEPIELALFENLPDPAWERFPLLFLEAVPVGADLSRVTAKFMHWILTGPDSRLAQIHEAVAPLFFGLPAIDGVAEALHRTLGGEIVPSEEWETLRAKTDTSGAFALPAAWMAAAMQGNPEHAGQAIRETARILGESHVPALADKLLELLAAAPVVEGEQS
jgi:hypothetical protein